MIVLYGADDEVSEWVAQNLFQTNKEFFGESPFAIGLVKKNKLICGVVYNNYRETNTGQPLSIEMSIFSIDKAWGNRRYLKAIFAYPFIQLGLKRVQISTSVDNEGMNSLAQKIGFKKEGLHRNAFYDGGDNYSWGMLKEECRWING